jgi:hypothetical protein
MGAIEVKYFNSFILRKTIDSSAFPGTPVWNGSRGDNTYNNTGSSGAIADDKNWAVEEARINGGYNNTSIEFGVKAYLVEDNPNSSIRSSSMIYSGIFNSRTGINDTNVFSVGEDITKSVNPANGSIQRIYAENTNLIIFQESKVSKALIDKNAIYSAEGGQISTTGNVVIGPVSSFSGNFGISRNPESFAVYGYRKYFTDKDRNAVLRLSRDGLTEISNYGMSDYFRDQLSTLDQSVSNAGKSIGAWDIHNKQYVLSLQPYSGTYSTLSFDDSINGFPSFFSYDPDQGISLKNNFYTLKDGKLFLHYDLSAKRGKFYGIQNKSSVTFVFNPKVSMSKVFKTINYEGGNGWEVNSFKSDTTGVNSIGTPRGEQAFVDGNQDITKLVYSYNQGSYDNYKNEYPAQLTPPINHAGFDRKENKYMANLINNSPAAAGEVELQNFTPDAGYSWGSSMTGIKGYFATVTMSTDSVTDVGGMKELFAVSSQYVESSY